MKVTLSRKTPLLQRVSRVLTADPAITAVTYWDGRSDTDVTVAYADDEVARRAPRFVVTADDHLDGPGMVDCNPLGLATALSRVANGRLRHISWAKPGTSRGFEPVRFPSPVGLRYGSKVTDTLTMAPAGSAIASFVVNVDTDQGPIEYAVVDDAEFLAAVCWAAGVIAALPVLESEGRLTPTDVAEPYVRACQAAGIVIARQEPGVTVR